MHRIDTDGSIAGLFTDGTPGIQVATLVDASFMNDLQENVTQFIENSGQTLIDGDYTQLEQAVANKITANSRKAGFNNVGWTYSDAVTGRLKITGDDGTDLSATNIGEITMRSKLNPGQLVTIQITSNSFVLDDITATTSDMVDLLGTQGTTQWLNVMPITIMGVLGPLEDETDFKFAVTRNMYATRTPATANIAWQGNAASSGADKNFIFMDGADPSATHDDKNCLPLGVLGATKSAADAWTFTDVGTYIGVGLDALWNTKFDYPPGHYGSDQDYMKDNGGGAPEFTTETAYYLVEKDGFDARINSAGDGGTDGSGAVTSLVTLPATVSAKYNSGEFLDSAHSLVSYNDGVSKTEMVGCSVNSPGVSEVAMVRLADATAVENASFGNGGRELRLAVKYIPFV